MRAFYDMAARFPWPHAPNRYGRGFRLGDRAAAYVQTLLWRRSNPDCTLTVVDDLHWPECADAKEFHAEWLFRGLADEVMSLEPGQSIPKPGDYNVYDRNLWDFWKELRLNPVSGLPIEITPPMEASETVKQLHSLSPFVVVQPLFDAGYNLWRNKDWNWWLALVSALAQDLTIVVACHSKHKDLPRLHQANVAYTWDHDLTPMQVLALAQSSMAFVGGETGLTLWAPIMQTPTYGLFAQQACHYMFDTAPISFGKPVQIMPLEAPPHAHAQWILQFVNGVKSRSAGPRQSNHET